MSRSYVDALFVRSAEPHGMRAATLVQREITIVDAAMYSKNRCLRLLFQSKYGKLTPMQILHGSHLCSEHPANQMLESLVTYVPTGTTKLAHELLNRDVLARVPSLKWQLSIPVSKMVSIPAQQNHRWDHFVPTVGINCVANMSGFIRLHRALRAEKRLT